MEGFIKFILLNVSLIIISFFILVLFLKYYFNVNIISIGFLYIGFKYVSKKINPFIESIKVNKIKFSYSRVKYSKSKIFIITVRGIRIKLSPTFVKNISKSEESNFLRKLNRKVIDGIYKYNQQHEIKKQKQTDTDIDPKNFNTYPNITINNNSDNNKLNTTNHKINKINDLNEKYNEKTNTKKFNIYSSQVNNNTYLKPNIKNVAKSAENLSNSKKKAFNKSSTLYSVKSVKKVSLLQTLIYMLDNKYIFEIIIPNILSKLAINIIDIKVDVSFPEGSKIIYKQDYISFLTEKKILMKEKQLKYFDYIRFKSYDPFNLKLKLLFSEFHVKFLEVDHSFTSSSPLSEKISDDDNDLNNNYDECNYKYKEYDILRSDKKNSIIISSIFNCQSSKTTCNFSFQDIKCNSDGWINLLRLHTIIKRIFENYTAIENKNKGVKIKGTKINEHESIISKYKNMVINNKNTKYIKNKIIRNNPLKSKKNKTNPLNKTMSKKFVSEFNCYQPDELTSVSNDDIFDNSSLNSFMNNEAVQIFLFYLKNARVMFNFEILNFQLISTSYYCGTNMYSNSNLNSNTNLNNKIFYNQDPQFVNVITIGEISFKGDSFKSKPKLYNIVTSFSLKSIYIDIIDYNSKYMVQFLNIKSIFTKLEAIIQFYKYKQHLSYMKNLNFDFEISTINITSDFDFSIGLYQHINYVINNISNKHRYKSSDDPLYNINKLLIASRAISKEDLTNSYVEDLKNSNYYLNDDAESIKKSSSNSLKKKKNRSLNDTIKKLSKLNKYSKLKVKFNFGIKDILFNYVSLSDTIREYYYINDSKLSFPNECIVIQFGIKNITAEYSNCNNIKFQNILRSSMNSLNSDNNNKSSLNSLIITDDNDKYIKYEEQFGLHEIEIEVHNVTSAVLFIDEDKIYDNSMIKINKIFKKEKLHGIDLDLFSTKVIFSIPSFEINNNINTKKEDKLLIGSYFGNLKFDFGSSKLASNILIILIDLIKNRIGHLSKLSFSNKIISEYDSNESLDSYVDDSFSILNDKYYLEMNPSSVCYSTPNLYNEKENYLSVSKKSIGQSVTSVYSDNSASSIDEYDESTNLNRYDEEENNILSHYMLIFDFKIRTISFSILNPEDECGFQFEIKKILFHYNNNCYITSSGESNAKNIIKPNNKIKNQFSFNIKEIDVFYLDTIKYMKKGIVVHHFLKVNDILINLVDVNARSLSSLGEISSLSSLSNAENLPSIIDLKSSNTGINLNKINFNIKKIRIYYSLDVFFCLLSTINFINKKLVNPLVTMMKKYSSQSDISTNNSNNDISDESNLHTVESSNNNNNNDNYSRKASINKTTSINSITLPSKENILNNIKLLIENIQLELALPDNIKLFIYLKESSLSYINNIKYDVNKILVLLPSQICKKSNLLKLKNISVIYNINKLKNNSMSEIDSKSYNSNNNNNNNNNNDDEEPLMLKVNGDSCIISIPYLFDLSDVIDSAVHLMKAMKTVICTVNGKVYVNTPTIIEPNEMIKALINCNMVSLQFLENDFESNLSKIYLYGTKEQKERVAREIAFEKKIIDLRNIKNQTKKMKKANNNVNISTNGSNNNLNNNNTSNNMNTNTSTTTTSSNNTTSDEDEANIEAKILKASQLLKKMNSSQWINIVKKYKEENAYTSSPLMGSISFYNVEALIDKPTLLGKTSEETIHIIDEQTPADKIYDTIVPIKLTLKVGSATMELRDFPEKMLYLPECSDDPERPSLIFIVSVFITEQDPNEECKRWVEVKYFHGRRSERILRTINPTKMFYNAKCIVQTDQQANFVWGYSIDPVFTHILQTISAFSKDSYDPSEKVGWWDKMRLNFHGSLDVVITHGCEFDVHILGSCSPYYTLNSDNSDYFGNNGINIIFSKGVNIKLGNTGVENEALRICCGEVFDSFSGFRTKFMHFKINLSSPSYYYAGLNDQHNYLHLSLDAVNYMMNFTEFMSNGLISLPVGVGPLFEKKKDKKVPMNIAEVSMKINIMPLMIGLSSYINDESFSNEFMIGIRCKAQTLNMEFNLLSQDNNGLDFTFSNAIITSLEGKIYTSGNAVSEEAKLYSFKGEDQNVDSKIKKKFIDDETEDIICWRNDIDKLYIHNNIPINSRHFISSSYVSYFKRNAIGDPEKLKKEYQIIENGKKKKFFNFTLYIYIYIF
ncbi:hypothetical protein U3516DRAFT_649360 [Neocallimastix sp. 'constans']